MEAVIARARHALAGATGQPVYRRLAEALAPALADGNGGELPSARALASELGLNRATVTAAYRELARRGLMVLRPGRRSRRPLAVPAQDNAAAAEEPQAGGIDLARYAPDRELLPAGKVFRWLGLGEGEGEGVAQYGSAWGYPPLRAWIAARLTRLGSAPAPSGCSSRAVSSTRSTCSCARCCGPATPCSSRTRRTPACRPCWRCTRPAPSACPCTWTGSTRTRRATSCARSAHVSRS